MWAIRIFIGFMIFLMFTHSNAACMADVTIGSDVRWISYNAEIVADEESRARGLMERAELPNSDAMLFLYPDSKMRAFWMKNTLIPLDIIFFDSAFKLINIVRNAEPHSLDHRQSEAPAQAVLEVNGGHMEIFGIEKPARLRVKLDDPNQCREWIQELFVNK